MRCTSAFEPEGFNCLRAHSAFSSESLWGRHWAVRRRESRSEDGRATWAEEEMVRIARWTGGVTRDMLLRIGYGVMAI